MEEQVRYLIKRATWLMGWDSGFFGLEVKGEAGVCEGNRRKNGI
jgi:hypothetical protein